MSLRRGTRRAAVIGLTLGAALSCQLLTPAWAAFVDGSLASMTVSTATLQPPTGLAATPSCSGLAARIRLTWTATPSTFASGYDVQRKAGGVFVTIGSVSGRTTTTYSDATAVLASTYEYRVLARVANWSAAAGSASATAPLICL